MNGVVTRDVGDVVDVVPFRCNTYIGVKGIRDEGWGLGGKVVPSMLYLLGILPIYGLRG